MEFVTFELAKKLKEKEFDCSEPFAMYNELGVFHPLYTSCEETLENCIFGNRCYYDYEDFDRHDFVCPTISQALEWLREEKKIEVIPSFDYVERTWGYQVGDMTLREDVILDYLWGFGTYEAAALAGIEFCLDYLI